MSNYTILTSDNYDKNSAKSLKNGALSIHLWTHTHMAATHIVPGGTMST